MLLDFKITEDFQHNDWSKQNLYKMNWRYEEYQTDNSNKFYFFRYVTVNNTDIGTKYFPCFLQARNVDLQLEKYANYIIRNSDDFINGKLIPVVLDPLEGNSENDGYVRKLQNKINFCKVYFIDGNYKLSEKHNNYTHYFTNHWVHHVHNTNEYKIQPLEKDHKIYINLNRVAREHRVKLMSKLIDLNLKDCGYNTWANTYDGYEMWRKLYPNIESVTYDILDVENVSEANPTMEIPVEFCKKSFLYIVTETHTHEETLFLSEKSYKPMRVGLPFIILGNPGTLELLKKLGFKTFDKWIDETYDLSLDLMKRIEIITKEINRFNNMSVEERLNIREEMKYTLQYNYNHLKTLKRNSDLVEALIDIKNRAT